MIDITAQQLYKKIETLNESPSELLDEAEVRELLQAFFDKSLMELPAEDLKPAFSLLRKINLNSSEQIKRIDFTDLISTLTFCFDLIYAQKEKRILFTSDTGGITVCAEPEKISLSFLNILFNIIEYANSPYFFVSLKDFSDRALIEIEFEGNPDSFEFPVFNRLINDYIYSLGGCILFLKNPESKKAVISVPVNMNIDLPEYQAPEVEDLLFDRLSVIYSSLF